MDEQPVLIEREGQLVGQRWTIDRDEYIIGRGGESALVLPERQVSRHHIKILNDNGRFPFIWQYNLIKKDRSF